MSANDQTELDASDLADLDAPDIELDRDHHNAHKNDEGQGFDLCFPVVVHCRSRDEARQLAKVVSDAYGSEEGDDGGDSA